MARRNTYTDNGSAGYSDKALKALNRGEYGKQTGRKAQYRTSSEQTQQVKKLPELQRIANGSSSAGSRNKTGNINTTRARKNYEQNVIEHTPIGRGLSKEDSDALYKVFDRNRLSSGGTDAIVHQLKNDVWTDTKDWEQKYGKSLEQIVSDFAKDFDKISQRKEAEYGEKHPVLATIKNVVSGGTAEPAIDLESTILGKVAPNSNLTNAVRNATENFAKQKEQRKEGVTSDMSDFGKGIYDIGTGLAERAIEYSSPSKLKYLLQAGKTAENKRQSLAERGIEGTGAEYQSLASGAVDALLDYVGLDKLPALKGLTESGNIGKEILGRAAIGSGEQGATYLIDEAIDRLVNGDKSIYAQNVADYQAQGMSADEAQQQANLNSLGQLGQEALSGALLNNIMGIGGRAVSNGLSKLPSLFGNRSTGTPEVDNAIRQSEAATAEVNNLANQIPETPNQGQLIDRVAERGITLDLTPEKAAERQGELAKANQLGMGFIPGDYKKAIRDGLISREDVMAQTTPELQDIVTRLNNNDESVTVDDILNLPEVRYAESRVIPVDDDHPDSWDNFKANPTEERRAYQKQLADDYYARGSAVLDEKGKAQYNGPVAREKKIFFVTGLPASGKSSTLVDKISQAFQARVLDSDDIKFAHREFDDGFGGNYIHEECKHILGDVTKRAKANGENLVVPIIGGGNTAKVAEKIRDYQKDGWEVAICQNDLPSKKAIGRAMTRFITDGRYIPPEVLYDYGETPAYNYEELTNPEGYVYIDDSNNKKGVPRYVKVTNFARVSNDVDFGQPAITEEYGGSLANIFGEGNAPVQKPDGQMVLGTRRGEGTGLPVIKKNIEPTPVSNDERVRSFSNRISGDEELPDEVRNVLSDDKYAVVHNADVKAKVDELFDPENLTQTRSNLEQALQMKDPSAALLSYKLAKAYVDAGEYDAATDVVRQVSAELTRSGQFTQAAKLAMMQNDPMAAMRSYMRDLDDLNRWGKEKYGKKWTNLELSKEDIDLFNGVQTGDKDALNAVVDQLNDKFGKQIPASLWDKIVAGTKTSMLLNLRTQGRNVFSNTAMLPVRSLSDRVSAVGQNLAHLINPDIKVTQSLTGGAKAQKEVAGQIFDSMKSDILGENKMKDSVKSGVLSRRRIFNDDFLGKWIDNATNGGLQRLNEKMGGNANKSIMETLGNLTYWLMGDVGDTPFVKKNFVNRLASYMKAQGITKLEDVPDDAIAIARAEALKATFKDDNAFTKSLEGVKKKTGKFGEVALPFVKTPANLAMRGIDYSPAGLVNTFRKIKSGEDAGRVIDELGKNLTGTAMIYLGYKLREKGILSGNYSEDRDEKAWQKQQGMLENAIHIGDKYYTFDWAQPTSTPLILGSVMYDAIKNSDDENASVLDGLNSAYKGGLAVTNSWLNTSPLQSVSDMFGGNDQYGDNGGTAGNIANEAIEFPQRLIPAQMGAIARTVDPTIRDTYTSDNTLTGIMGNQLRSAVSKVPGLSKTLPASYDSWGNERTRSDTKWGAALSQNVNPGQFGNKNETPLDAEISRLYSETGNNAVFPTSVKYSVKLGDETKKLTNKEHSEYQKTIGQTSYKLAEALMNSDAYKEMSDIEKASALSDVYGLADRVSKEKLFNYTGKDADKLKDAYTAGGEKGAIDYIVNKSKAKQLGMNVDTYIKKQSEYEGGAEQYAQDRDAAKALGIDADVYAKKQASYEGGAQAYVEDRQKAIDYGFVDKDGSANMKNYEIAKNVFGDDDAALRDYSDYKKQGFNSNSQKVPYLKDNNTFTNEQKGMILAGHSDGTLGDNAAKGATEMFNMGGYEGYYYYYLIKELAESDGKKGISKAERNAYFAGDSQELDDLWNLNQDMYTYLMNNLK